MPSPTPRELALPDSHQEGTELQFLQTQLHTPKSRLSGGRWGCMSLFHIKNSTQTETDMTMPRKSCGFDEADFPWKSHPTGRSPPGLSGGCYFSVTVRKGIVCKAGQPAQQSMCSITLPLGIPPSTSRWQVGTKHLCWREVAGGVDVRKIT